MAYSDEIIKPVSEKTIIAHMFPSERLIIFTLDTGSTYKRVTNYFSSAVREDGTALTLAASSTLSSGEFYYDSETGELFVRMSDDSNPNTKVVVVDYKLFFADKPTSLAHDLSSGNVVPYDGLIDSVSSIKKEIDQNLIGIALESQTNLSFSNNHGFFDENYDTIIWENKAVKIYSIVEDQIQLIFDGIVQDKSISTTKATFKCKDFLFKLRQPLSQDLFATSDGSVLDRYLNTPKRTLFGQFKQLKTVPIDSIKDGYALTGTMTGAVGSTTLTGSGTAFLDECSPNDSLFVTNDDDTISEYKIESVDSDTVITLSDEIELIITAKTMTNKPELPWRKKNRVWHVAGHKLRAPSTTVVSGISSNRFTVADASDFFADDAIKVDGVSAIILRVSGSQITLTANLQAGAPSASDTVIKNPISKVYAYDRELFIDRDYSISNTTDCKITLLNTAERNVQNERPIEGTITFTNASTTVTASGVDLLNFLQPRDWIKTTDITHTTDYEVLSVSEASLELRVAYAGTTYNSGTKIIKPQVLDDNGFVTVNCLGKESAAGEWVNTSSRTVKELLTNDIGITNINTASFDEAHESAAHVLSIASPEEIGGKQEIVRDVIGKANQSTFGSLSNNSDWELSYSVYDQKKPEAESFIDDSDITSDITVKSVNKIVRKVNARYGAFTDIITGEPAFELYEFTNPFVDNLVGVLNELDITLYLFNLSEATTIAQRWAMFKSMSQTEVTVKTDLRLALKNLNDKLYLNMSRLYKRFGGADRQKIGSINYINKSATDMTVRFVDQGNSYNRVCSIAPNTANVFTSATDAEKVKNGYLVDNNLEVPDVTSDQEIYQNLIG